MRSLAIALIVCAGCAAGVSDESTTESPRLPNETKSAPVDVPEEAEDNPLLAWHHWFTIDVPAAAEGMLELNVAATPTRPIEAASITVFDAEKRAVGTGEKGWFSVAVAPGERYFVDVYADPSRGEVKLLSSFKPVVDAFEPNDDIAHATTLVPGKPSQVRLFANRSRNGGVDTDYFRVVAQGKRTVRLYLANGSQGVTYCADVLADGATFLGGSCSAGDLDASFELPAHTGAVYVKLSGANATEASTFTLSADY